MKNGYFLRMGTSKNLGSETFAYSLLQYWCVEIDARLRPEFFGPGEPVRRKLETEGVEGAARLWLSNQMPVMLRRSAKPRFLADIWWRPDRGKDPRPYPWGCQVFLDRSAGDELALTLFSFLIEYFEPAFGLVSTSDDSRAKHQVTWREGVEQVSQYMGLDLGRFASIRTDYGHEVLPGVYWVTYFGPGANEIVSQRNLERLTAYEVNRLGQGCLVRAYPSVSVAGTELAHQAERRIKEQLGEEHFFEKSQVDIESLKADEATAARVERKIEEVKAAQRNGHSRPL